MKPARCDWPTDPARCGCPHCNHLSDELDKMRAAMLRIAVERDNYRENWARVADRLDVVRAMRRAQR